MKEYARLDRPIVMRVLTATIVALLSAAPVGAHPGDLDPSFGNGGTVASTLGYADTVIVDRAGRIVVGGTRLDPRGALIARYDANGHVDASFGTDGVVVIAGAPLTSLVLQSDGKVVVAIPVDGDHGAGVRLVRLDLDGAVDASFGTEGSSAVFDTTTDSTDYTATTVLVLPDDRLLLVGTSCDRDDDFCSFAVVRRDADGNVDDGFGTHGIVRTPIANGAAGEAGVLLSDGRLVVAGRALGNDTDPPIVLARYATDGRLDATFGDAGQVVLPLPGHRRLAVAVAVAPDDAVLVTANGGMGRLVVARLHADGSLDRSFGVEGAAGLPAAPATSVAYALAVQPDGRIIVAGATNPIVFFDWLLAALLPEGTSDPTFGANGVVTTSFGSQGDAAFAVAIQPDGRIVAVGGLGDGPGYAVTRYLGTMRRCADADGDGRVTVTDGVLVLRAAADLSSSCLPAFCDADGNGAISVSDGVLTLRGAAGLPAPVVCSGE